MTNRKDDTITFDDVEAGYGPYFAGFEAGANYAYQQVVVNVEEALEREPQTSLMVLMIWAMLEWADLAYDKKRAIFEDHDGDITLESWRRLHPKNANSRDADDWHLTIPKLWVVGLQTDPLPSCEQRQELVADKPQIT